MARAVLLLCCALLVRCDSASSPTDLDAAVESDLGFGFDLAAPATCAPIDPMDDGQTCGTACPIGLQPVSQAGECHCYHVCDPIRPTSCSCNRRCATLKSTDGGVSGGACLVGNGPGERCGFDPASKPYGNGGCAQATSCVNEDATGANRYCVYDCTSQANCPAHTSCLTLRDPNTGATIGMACALDSGDTGKDVGQACGGIDVCKTGSLCDGVCRSQCDGPGAMCQTGSCTALTDGSKIIGYVCK